MNAATRYDLHEKFVTDGLIFGANALPDGGKALAVTAPGGVELNEDVLAVIIDDIIEALPDNVVDRVVLGRRNDLALELRFDFACNVLLDPVGDTISSDLLALSVGVLELLLQVLDDEGGPLDFHEVKGAGVVTELDGVNPDEVDLRLVFSGDGLDSSNLGLLVLGSWVDEEVCKGLGAGSVGSIVFTTNLVDDGDREFLDPLLKVLLGQRANGVGVLGFRLVEGAIDNNSRRGDTGGFGSLLVSRETEEVVITVALSGSAEFRSGGVGGRRKVGNGHNLVGLLELLEVGFGDLRDGGQ